MNERKINEKVDKMVREQISQILMLEYSIDRKSFINRVYSLSPMIISHWCLIKHNRLIDDENYISHWKNEVGGWMLTLMNSKLKKNNSVEYKLKALTQGSGFFNRTFYSYEEVMKWKDKLTNDINELFSSDIF